jgi:hypothetical protein
LDALAGYGTDDSSDDSDHSNVKRHPSPVTTKTSSGIAGFLGLLLDDDDNNDDDNERGGEMGPTNTTTTTTTRLGEDDVDVRNGRMYGS